jgi:hypothetical protein
MKSTTGGRHLLSILAATLFSAGCGRGAPEGAFTGDWVRVDHPSAWLVTLAEDGAAALRNRTLDETVRGRWTAIDTSDVVIVVEGLRHGLPDTLRLGVEERAGGTLRATGSDGDPWVLVRYGPVPRELLGRWLTYPRNDPRYFIEFDESNEVLWRRRFGMRRSEDRVGSGWTRGDSLFLHIWGSPPMHYTYEITGDTLQFQRPGIGPFGRYIRVP